MIASIAVNGRFILELFAILSSIGWELGCANCRCIAGDFASRTVQGKFANKFNAALWGKRSYGLGKSIVNFYTFDLNHSGWDRSGGCIAYAYLQYNREAAKADRI